MALTPAAQGTGHSFRQLKDGGSYGGGSYGDRSFGIGGPQALLSRAMAPVFRSCWFKTVRLGVQAALKLQRGLALLTSIIGVSKL